MLLVARRGFTSPFFYHTVIFLLHHDAESSFGVIINQPRRKRLSEVVDGVEGSWLQDLPVYHGGPVDAYKMLILLRTSKPPLLTEPVTDDLHFSSYPLLLHDLALRKEAGITLRCYSGLASWSPGQLEDELRKGYWHLMQAEPGIVFQEGTENLWETLIDRLETVVPIKIE
ncbi:MAG: YqgE/AlgH family protein [Pseudomonadota bacterium]